ncbi:MAG: acyl-CoA dehydrogenase family protein [Pseudomonadales bacterium]|nr:acyl-CoA dehydrogenase family protein [Pseudomonadales bacterium]
MSIAHSQCTALKFHLRHIAKLPQLRGHEVFSHADDGTLHLILEQAAQFSTEVLAPLAAQADRQGCRLEDSGVKLPDGAASAYQLWRELGFPLFGTELEHGGLGFPLAAQVALQELCDGANLAFGMLAINQRCALRAVLTSGNAAQCTTWLPGLISGDIASTIAISEAQAGSDVGRISTRATPLSDDNWRLDGVKLWISYGDHDASEQILHFVLARVPNGEVGTRGLGLFLVPKLLADGSRNALCVARLEHKMGLHGSPTCVLELNGAQGSLLGGAGKGLQALFPMMNAMRLAVAAQGAAVSNAAALHAIRYAQERPQGGDPRHPAVAIATHADVRRMLLEMTAQGELARALALRCASFLDLARATGETRWQKLAELLLPIAKTVCAEIGFKNANQGIQVLGGYGYSSDYPLERLARDIRVATIYEGTSGIQALDLLKRKIIADDARTLHDLLHLIRADCAQTASPFSALTLSALTLLEHTLTRLCESPAPETGAYALLQLCAQILHGWNAHCLLLAATDANDEYQTRLHAALTFHAHGYAEACHYWAERALSELPAYSFVPL